MEWIEGSERKGVVTDANLPNQLAPVFGGEHTLRGGGLKRARRKKA